MRSRGLWMMVLAVVAGLGAVVLATRWMQRQGGDRSHVAVASTEIAMGARLAPELIRVVDWPRSSVPPGAFQDGAAISGRVVTVALHPGEPVLEARLAPVGSKGGLSAVVPVGKRAMTVRVNDVIAVAGFALPGTYVDVLVNTMEEGSGAHQNDKDHSVSKIVLEHILVLAAAQESDRDDTKPRVVNAVTLEVTPQQAEVLDLARSVGTLSLVLRNQSDPEPADTTGATKALMLAMPNAPAASAPAHPAPVVAPKPVPRVAAPAPRRVVARAPAPPASVPSSTNCVEIIRGLVKTTECF